MKLVAWAAAIIIVIAVVLLAGKITALTGMSKKYRKAVTFTFRTIILAIGIEALIINFDYFRVTGDEYIEQTLNIEKANVKNYNKNTGATNGENGYIEFKDLNCRIKTIKINVKSASGTTLYFDILDDTNTNYRNNIAYMKLEGGRNSNTVIINMSGNVHDLKIDFSTDGEVINISDISLNVPIKMSFNPVRFWVMLAAAFIFYVIGMSVYNRKSVEENKKFFKGVCYTMTVVFILIALAITIGSKGFNLKEDFTSKSGNQITKEIVDAFEAGQLSLLTPVSDELLELDNPYDWSERSEAGISYLWDHLLFEGKYYSYYGIAPVLLVFLPYHVATGYYFPSTWAVFIFGAIGILFLTKFFICLLENFFPKLGTNIAYGSLVILQMVTGIWFCFNVPNFYEIAQTSGFACVTCGAYFLLSSGVIGERRLSKARLALSSVFLALAVLCRPTLVLYCIIAVVFILFGLKKEKSLKYFMAALLPYVLIGGIQMWYNYERFHSVFDFGIQYSLTINDFTRSEFHPEFAFIGYYNYLFALPSITNNFPYIDTSKVLTFLPQGYYFVATKSAVGIFVKALPAFSYLYAGKAYKKVSSPDKKRNAILILLSCVLVPLIIIFSIWESGYGARYAADFAWEFLIGALIIAYIIYERCSESNKRKLDRAMAVSVLLCAVLTVIQIYSWILIA